MKNVRLATSVTLLALVSSLVGCGADNGSEMMIRAIGASATGSHAATLTRKEAAAAMDAGTVAVKFSGLGGARHVMSVSDIASVAVTVTAANGKSQTKTLSTADLAAAATATFSGVAVGSASVDVVAYDANHQALGQGNSQANVQAGQTAQVALAVHLLPSTGNLAVNVTFIDDSAPDAPAPTPTPVATTGPSLPGYTLTFDDEFNDGAIDWSRWMSGYWFGNTMDSNNEDEHYEPSAVSEHDGMLSLKATYDPQGNHHYSSGAVTTFQSFAQTYGRFEIRCRLPKGRGLWPAFWLCPQSKAWPPEIDVFEVLGQEPNKVYMTNHYVTATNSNATQGGIYQGDDYSAGFHVFAIDWKPGLIVWSIDGVERFRSTQGVPDVPMYPLVNLAVGGNGSWPGAPDATTQFPASFDVDYVRVYKQN